MKTTGPSFLSFTSISPHDGHQTLTSVPVGQVQEIKDAGFPAEIPGMPMSIAKALVTMRGKDGASYWTVESRAALVEQINGKGE